MRERDGKEANTGCVLQLATTVGSCNSVLLGDYGVHYRNGPRITPPQEGKEAGVFTDC